MSAPAPRRRSGFTLVEVAIALAIFVFGALAIVRIFPPALGVIRNNESRATASQLSQSTLSRFRNRTSPPPEAIFDVDANGNWQDYGAAVVGTVNKNSSLPKSPLETDYQASALGHFRYIHGEPHYIASGQTVLLNRPIDSTLTSPLDQPQGFYEAVIEGVQIAEDGYLDFSNAYIASSDSPEMDKARLSTAWPSFHDTAFPKSPPNNYRRNDDVTYYVSYRWHESSAPTIIKGVLEEPLSIPNGILTTNHARVLPCVVNSSNRAVPGGVTIKMRREVTITINPTPTAGQTNKTASIAAGSYPGTYYISYLSSDWRTLVDDSAPLQKPGAATTGIIKLPLTGLDDTFGSNGVLSATLTQSDQKGGTTLLNVSPNPPPVVDRKKGEIEYTIPTPTWNGPRIRTLYRVLDGWAHQLSVAPRCYVPFSANLRSDVSFPREPWREYHWDSTDAGLIYFHPSEAGKTVAVAFLDGAGKPVNSICTIEDDLITRPTSVNTGFIGPGNTASKVARLFITDAIGDNATPTSLLSVQGLSIRTRTAWLNNDRYNQVITPIYRALTQ